MYSKVWPEARILENLCNSDGITFIFLINSPFSWETDWVPNAPLKTVIPVVLPVLLLFTLKISFPTCKKSPGLIAVVSATFTDDSPELLPAVAIPLVDVIVIPIPVASGDKAPAIFSEASELSWPNEFKLYL